MPADSPPSLADVPVFVLCGGLGTRFREETEFRPKPMIEVGHRPILWHIMRSYAAHGFKRFVLCLGYKAEVIKEYFLHYSSLNSDFTVDLSNNEATIHSVEHKDDWSVTLAFTGDKTMTGGRIARAAQRYLGDAEHFAVTYGDGVCDADLGDEFRCHLTHDRIGTVLGVNPPSRFGEIRLEGNNVLEFSEKPEFEESWINGGYFFFRRAFLEYLSADEACVLERAPLVNLAADHQLSMYKHPGFWQCMDTQRDKETLEGLWASGEAPWARKPTDVDASGDATRSSQTTLNA
ncbi:Glucose-1-phosphate cytidylyltransferase [Pseudobythopirellula maris]|uniref:Glucose-1-phosphate cytidylyltransferase n=1 Tax=Pseudobythopirellula maris TaxID=2527991 RepID=A0A5C5ZJE9_9BACT|nr:glucose-1-phosphate cytidylyltransferase [Pseudobythopirellula maris]TWT87504.1 Glucose-1-phosphate cytidylyltransferase [Pseudobythopirellula maris]